MAQLENLKDTPLIRDRVYDALRKEILMGGFAPGETLNILSISKQMGISCAPIREALNMLNKDGLVELMPYIDVIIGNEEDFQLCLGIEGPEAGGKDIASKIDGFKEMIRRVKKEYPGAQVFATTLRQVNNTNSHNWGAIMLEGDTWHVVEPREIHVLDRIGGGDGFVGGLLYAVLKGWEPEKWIQFGWASGALATTFLTDYGQPADEEQVWSIWQGNARVKR